MPKLAQTFDQWKAAVDAEIVHKVGLTADDLPDYAYYDAFEDGLKPATAANHAIREAGGF